MVSHLMQRPFVDAAQLQRRPRGVAVYLELRAAILSDGERPATSPTDNGAGEGVLHECPVEEEKQEKLER
jgi:hypothetical protein